MSNSPIHEWYFYLDDMIRFSKKVIHFYGLTEAEIRIVEGVNDGK